jgi:hypothetical protein
MMMKALTRGATEERNKLYMFMFCEYKMYPLYMYKEMPTVSLTDQFIGHRVCKSVGSCTF